MKQILLIVVLVCLLFGGCIKRVTWKAQVELLGMHLYEPVASVSPALGRKLNIGDTVIVCCPDGGYWQIVCKKGDLDKGALPAGGQAAIVRICKE
jgi:hypothetical protein